MTNGRKVKVKAKKTGKSYEYTYSYDYTSTLVCVPFTNTEKEFINLVFHKRKLASLEHGEPLSKRQFVHDILMDAVMREVQ